jgi:hypothetical protein
VCASRLRTCSRTARETGAAGASGAAWARRCPTPSRGGPAQLGGGATAPLQPAGSGGAVGTFDGPRPPVAARPLGALLRCPSGLQVAGRLPMVPRVEATSEPIATPRRCPCLAVRRGSHGGGVALQVPPAQDQHPCAGTPLTRRDERTGPGRAHGTRLAQARGAGHPVKALPAVVAPCTRLERLAATAWTREARGPAPLSSGSGSFLVLVPVRYPVLQRVAPTGLEQPYDTDTVGMKL